MRCQQRHTTLPKSATIDTWKRTRLCGVTVNGLPPQGSCSAVELRLAKALIDAVVDLTHPLLQLLLRPCSGRIVPGHVQEQPVQLVVLH